MKTLAWIMATTLAIGAGSVDKPGAFTTEAQTLINGEVVDRAEFPATIWIGGCTAVLVGPRVVLTAAHCVRNGTRISFATNLSDTFKYKAACMHGDHYRGNSTADYAICYTESDVTKEHVPEFEVLATDPEVVQVDDWILQSGFGCTKWGRRLDMLLRVGLAQLIQGPSGKDNDFETGNGAVLCSGDSGGPAWSLKPDGSRDMVISTNSRSNTTSRSYLSAWVTPHGKAAIEKFRTAYPDALICGIHENAPRCRNKPKEPVVFAMESPNLKLLSVTVQPEHEVSADDLKIQLEAALESLGG